MDSLVVRTLADKLQRLRSIGVTSGRIGTTGIVRYEPIFSIPLDLTEDEVSGIAETLNSALRVYLLPMETELEKQIRAAAALK